MRSGSRFAPLAAAILVIWSVGYPIGAIGLSVLPAFELLLIRFGCGAVVLAALAVAQGAAWPRGRLFWHCVVAGLLSQALQFGGAFAGVQAGVPVAVSALVLGLSPVLTSVLGAVFLRERLTRARVIALVLGVGAVVAALGARVAASHGVDGATVLVLLALVGSASGATYQQRFCRAVDVRSGAAVQLAAAVVPVGIIAVTEGFYVRDVVTAAWVLAFLVLLNSALGTTVFLAALRIAGAARTSLVFSLVPAVSAMLSWAILGQRPTGGVVVGLVLGAAACLLGTRTPKPSPVPATETV